MKNEAIPRLRFKGFHDKWFTSYLGKLFDLVTDYTSNGSFKSLKVNVHTYSSPHYAYLIRTVDNTNNWKGPWKYTDKHGFNFLSKSRLYPGDIIISNTGAIGTVIIVPKLDRPMTLAPNSILVRSYKNNNKFLYQLMITPIVQYHMKTIAIKGAQPKLNKTNFKHIKVHVTDLPEQQLIGKFFTKLDKLIQLQQKKVSLLKKLKRGYLQKLCPQPGTCFPLLRFKGFFKPWSCSKASTLFKSISEKNHPKLPVLSSTQTKGLVYRKDLNSDIKYNPKSLPNYKVIHKGDFVISLRSFQGGFECSNKLGIISAAYTVFNFINRFNQNTYFWKTFFKSYIFLQLLKKITFGIRDGKSIKFTSFKSLKLKYPSYKEECKLGKLFKNMNNNIDIQKNKLTHLRKLKKAYLQKMFC